MPSEPNSAPEPTDTTPDAPSSNLADLRGRIDDIDAHVLQLLSQRAGLALEVGKNKAKTSTNYFAPDRERQIFDRLTALNNGPLPHEAVRAIYREIISASRALETPLQIAFLGPPGTFSHRAALLKFGSSSQPQAVDTIPDVFDAVERGAAHYGVVPVENSTEGVVPYTLDRFSQTNLKICGEVFVPVVHNVAAKSGTLKGIKRLYAHPQASAQSRNWTREHLPKVEIVDVTSNSKSAQMAQVDSEGAAITTEIAAEINGLPLVARHIEDSPHNRTRFLVIGQNEPRPSGRDKTSIFFSVRHKAGSLMRAMAAFESENVNLTMIESRPTKQMPWEYVFFIDFQGHRQEEAVQRALQKLEQQSLFVTILGSYPESE